MFREQQKDYHLTWALWINHVPVKPVVSGFVLKILASKDTIAKQYPPGFYPLSLFSGRCSQKT